MSDVIPGVPSSGTITRAVVCKSLSAAGKRGHGAGARHPGSKPRQTTTISGSRKFPLYTRVIGSLTAVNTRTRVCQAHRGVHTCAHCCTVAVRILRFAGRRRYAWKRPRETAPRPDGVASAFRFRVSAAARTGQERICFRWKSGRDDCVFFSTPITNDATPNVKSKT